MEAKLSKDHENRLLEELKALDSQAIEIDGKTIKASQCYHWETDPAHLLYNTNCPPDLKKKLELIIAKYIPVDEDSTSK